MIFLEIKSETMRGFRGSGRLMRDEGGMSS
jgi:hypothetical protein